MDGAPFLDLTQPDTAPGKIGPNAVIQLGHAVTDRLGRGAAMALYAHAGVPGFLDTPPGDMTDERIPIALYRSLWALFPDDAPDLARESGLRTAEYIIANRIPRVAQVILRACPQRMGARLLLKAIRQNAWTFAGSGRCDVRFGRRPLISITDNPLVMPECAWHRAVFERLFDRLVACNTQVRHVACCRQNAPACRFEIRLPERARRER